MQYKSKSLWQLTKCKQREGLLIQARLWKLSNQFTIIHDGEKELKKSNACSPLWQNVTKIQYPASLSWVSGFIWQQYLDLTKCVNFTELHIRHAATDKAIQSSSLNVAVSKFDPEWTASCLNAALRWPAAVGRRKSKSSKRSEMNADWVMDKSASPDNIWWEIPFQDPFGRRSGQPEPRTASWLNFKENSNKFSRSRHTPDLNSGLPFGKIVAWSWSG